MTPTPADLRRFLMEFFDDEEIEAFCFDYFREVGQNFTLGMTKNRKVLLLLGYCERRGRMADLTAALARERPEPWARQAAAAPQPAAPVRDAAPPPPAPRDPRQVFLSHAHQDADFARRLAADLREEGRPVWLAPDSIRPGEKWVEAIERGLAESGVFLLVLSPEATASRWVRTEAAAAIDLEHEGAVRVIPLDVAAAAPPLLWRQYQYVSFRDSYEAGLDALLARLEEPDADEAPDAPAAPVAPSPREAPPREEPATGQPGPARATAPAARRRKADPPAAPRPEPAARYVHEKTGIELIRIPAGTFLFGALESDRLSTGDERPQRAMTLPAFAIGRTPVTNAQYSRFLEANPAHPRPAAWKSTKQGYPRGRGDHPVQVTLDDALAFCQWAGLRLPTEVEWEKAARGTDGRRWPWGDKPPTRAHANVNNFVGDTTPVGTYSPLGDSPYGCADMAGNVNEWTATRSSFASFQVVRGGDFTGTHRWTRASRRNITNPGSNLGFRVASDE